jgi:hypothetical protein
MCARATSARDASLREVVLPLFTLSNSHLSRAGTKPTAGTRIEPQLFVPAAACALRVPPRVRTFFLHQPPPRGGGAPTGACSMLLCRAGQARRAPCDRCARLSALHRGDFWPGEPARPVRQHRLRRTGLAAPAVTAWPAVPDLRCRGRKPPQPDATPAPPSGSSPETPLIERDTRFIPLTRYVVNIFLQIAPKKMDGRGHCQPRRPYAGAQAQLRARTPQ